MDAVLTQPPRIVQVYNTLECGRILVVDDDRTFGGFMQAALESRGHNVEWAGCVSDGLASLYAQRYDLVIVDLRLPDGSGLSFVREATDEGLLAGSSAIILTGDDFDEPDDIRVYRKTADIEQFLDRAKEIVAQTKRRRSSPGPKKSHAAVHGSANDRGARVRYKLDLVLYTSAESEKSRRALRAIHEVLEQYEAAQVRLVVRDLSALPHAGDEDAVVFTPTLVKRSPGARTWIVGNLEHADLLVDLLEMSGVDRRRDHR